MSNKIQAIRGMNDVLPDQTPLWQYLEGTARTLLAAHGYREIRTPVLEQTQLFKRSIGEVTDIVEKEMYTFEDRNGDSLSLRPEGTAGCVRAAEQHGLLYNQTQRLWYTGPMYRHERPQKGRYRQFYQIGVEAFGMPGVDIETEILLLTDELWKRLKLSDAVTLELNNIGNANDRARFGAALKDFLEPRRAALDPDSQRRLDSNVLRILDSKVPETRALLEGAPVLADFVNPLARAAFDSLLGMLDKAGVAWTQNPALVRGLDYYNGLVFEWTTPHLGSQATVCAGGRFDGLARQLGGSDTSAVGFAMGVERLVLLIEELQRAPEGLTREADVYLAVVGEGVQAQAQIFARDLRQALPELRIVTHCGGGKYNSQMKKAYNSGARCALVLEGDTEVAQVKGRLLSEEGESVVLPLAEAADWIRRIFVQP